MIRIHLSRHARRTIGPALAAAAAVTGLLSTPPAGAQAPAPASSAETPRLPSGRPDLSGPWNGTGRPAAAQGNTRLNFEQDGNLTRLGASRRCGPNQAGCRDNTNQANDAEFTFRIDANRPVYKPEHWDRVQFLDYDTNFSDPMMRCLPFGVPRVGPPHRILQTANDVVFLYNVNFGNHDYRVIPITDRPPDPDAFPAIYGHARARWEGDTLVIRTSGFTDQTWIASGIQGRGGGYFHSFEMVVTERIRREGDILHYQATVEDPEVLIAPWTMNAYRLILNTDLEATLPEGLPCREYDSEITVSRIRH